MKVLVVGGDGFCGWPTSLHLSNKGHEVLILDNLSRRKIDIDLGVSSLTPIASIETRLEAWTEKTGREIGFQLIDVAMEYDKLLETIKQYKPDSIVHFGEQRAAPYSMKNSSCKRYTVSNNVNGTNNILCAVAESGLDIHLVHLGTMGVYGYGTVEMEIPEGYLTVGVKKKGGEYEEAEILYPTNPGSIYHMTKSLDQLMFAFYAKNDKLKITDLHQGIVWGTDTVETKLDKRLINRFDYDGDYGTVLNRFLLQAAVGHPLTVHGTGGQTRAFIHIQDTVRCVELAVTSNTFSSNKVRILNQMTETHTVGDLARLISSITGCELNFLPNPRNEAESNNLEVSNKCLVDLGLVPTKLEKGLLNEISMIASEYRQNCDMSKIVSTSYWNDEIKNKFAEPEPEPELQPEPRSVSDTILEPEPDPLISAKVRNDGRVNLARSIN